MRKSWKHLPVRLRAALAALALFLALLTLWGFLGWAVPVPRLALRLAERAHAYGPGQIAARGELSFQSEESAPMAGKTWFVSRMDDRFAAVVLERKLGVLWQCRDFWVLRPTEEAPLSFTYLGWTTIAEVSHGIVAQTGMEEIVAVCSSDPEIVSVELTMGIMPLDYTDGPAAWLAERGVTVTCTPAGEQVWVGQVVLADQISGATVARLRGYDADGTLLYDARTE